MKKSLVLSLLVTFIMLTSLAPTGLGVPHSTNVSNQNFNISDFVQSRGDITSPRSLTSNDLVNSFSQSNSNWQKAGETLTNWLDSRKQTTDINFIGGEPSIMMMISGNDPTLGGQITPLGSFAFGDTGIMWVHTTADQNQITSLLNSDQVIRIEADKVRTDQAFKMPSIKDGAPQQISTAGGLSSTTVSSLQNFNHPFYANDIIGATQVKSQFGYAGDGTVVNVMDSGVDFGQTALVGTLALDKNNQSASFGGWGGQMGVSNLLSQQYYLDRGETAKASNLGVLHDSNGYIDTSNLGNMLFWSGAYSILGTVSNTGIPWMNHIPLPQLNVTGLAGNSTGFAFGFALVYNGGLGIVVPYLLADTTTDGNYDQMRINFDAVEQYTRYWNGKNANLASVDFTKATVFTNDNNQYLSADMNSDGFNDISLGALSNTYDGYNLTGRLGNSNPIMRGIDSQGYGFAYFADIDTHGTSVAGEVAAQPVSYQVGDTGSINIEGVAPNTDIIGTQYITESSFIYSSLWVTGYEPNNNLEWNFVNDHIANITSNSWGGSGIEFENNFAVMYDFTSLFLDLLTQPGYLSAQHPGILAVFSSGNAGPGYGTLASTPLGGNILMVGASTGWGWMEESWFGLFGEDWSSTNQGFDQVAGFSSNGPGPVNYPMVDVVSIGEFDFSVSPTVPFEMNNDSYTLFSGTSEAAPLTSGVLSLMYNAWKAVNGSTLAPDLAKVILKSTAKDIGFDAYQQGSGRVDALAAVAAIRQETGPAGDYFLSSSTDSMTLLGDKLATAFDYWFGSASDLNVTGYSGLSHPALTENIRDSAIYGGSVNIGSSQSIAMTVDNSTDITGFTDFTFNTENSAVKSSAVTQSTEYGYTQLFSINSTDIGTADYAQVSVSYDPASLGDRQKYSAYPYMMIISVNDANHNGIVDKNERSLYNLDLASYTTDILFLGGDLFNKNTYVAIYDPMFQYKNQRTLNLPDLSYHLSLRSFKRGDAAEVSVSQTAKSSFTVQFAPTSNTDVGYHQGFIKLTGNNGSSLIPYTYTVPLAVKDYATNGWSTISGARDKPMENGVFGSVDYSWRYDTGDWRYYELNLQGSVSTANSLGLEVEWTYPGTMVDLFILDNDGQIIQTSNIVYRGAGVFASTANNPPSMQRFLLNLTDYRTGNTMTGDDLTTGYSTFTVALHAVRVDGNALPYDPLTIRAAWVPETVSQFSVPQPSLVRTGTQSYQGFPVTSDVIGVDWSKVTTNPIPSFNTNNPQVQISVFNRLVVDEQKTISSSNLVSYAEAGNKIKPEFTKTVSLDKGAKLVASLDWANAGSDFDFVVVPKGSAISFANDIFKNAMASSAKPESGTTTVPASGQYVLAVEWFSGDSSVDQEFNLHFESRTIAYEANSIGQSQLSTSLVSQGALNNKYQLVSTIQGWNFDNTFTSEFYFDNVGPTVDSIGTIPEATTGNIVIGKVNDAVIYDYSLKKGTSTLQSGTDVSGPVDLIVNASEIPGANIPVTFTLEGSDALGHTSSFDFNITRQDETAPVLTIRPENPYNATANRKFTITMAIDDASDGQFTIKANGDIHSTGNWTAGELLKFDFKFQEVSTVYIVFDFVDNSGNLLRYSLKVYVGKNTGGSSGGFLPISMLPVILALVAIIPIIRRKVR